MKWPAHSDMAGGVKNPSLTDFLSILFSKVVPNFIVSRSSFFDARLSVDPVYVCLSGIVHLPLISSKC